jgi:Tfp pilus assembly protein PilF
LAGARKSYERALEIDENVYGPDHPEVATDVNNLGLALQKMGDLESARENLERSLEIFRHFLGEDHPTTKLARKNLESVRR